MKLVIAQNYRCPGCNDVMNVRMSEEKQDTVIVTCETNLHCTQRYKVYEVKVEYAEAFEI